MTISTVAALQIGSSPEGKTRTLEHVLAFESEIAAAGAAVVMPEALLGGYPKGEIFGTRLGYRLPEGREAYARYHDNAIDVRDRKPRRWRACRGAPAPAWWWA